MAQNNTWREVKELMRGSA